MNAKNLAKATEIWQTLNRSERFGCQFGMFPADKMPKPSEGYDTHEISVALMDMAMQPDYMKGAV